MVHVGRDRILERLARCEGVARSLTSNEDLRRFLERISPLRGDLPIRTNLNVRPMIGSRQVATIHVQIDDSCPEIAVLDVDGIRAILEHALTAEPMDTEDVERFLTVRALAGDADGRRAGSTSLGIAGGTPWSDPTIAGHGPGWSEPDDPIADAADLPFVHVVRVRGDGLTLEQCVVFDSPHRIEIDPMTMLRVMAESEARAQRADATRTRR